MGDLEKIWTEVEMAVAESLNNAEGVASAWYLEHHFNKAGLGVFRLPDDPTPREIDRILAELDSWRTRALAAEALTKDDFRTATSWPT